MAFESASPERSQGPRSARAQITARPRRPRGRAPVHLPAPYAAILDHYTTALRSSPLSAQTRRTYASKVRQFLAWLADGQDDGQPLHAADARDRAVREYRTHLHDVLERRPTTINVALAAIDDLYSRRGLGPADAGRADPLVSEPRALSKPAALRFLRALEASPSARDRALALVPFYAGVRIAEIVALDIEDLALGARTGSLRIYRGQRVREIPIHPKLRGALRDWLGERANWRGAEGPALFLSRQGKRISLRMAHEIITATAQKAGLENDTTAHVLRHTFATRLVQGGTDLQTVAELLGHARLQSTLVYTRPTPLTRTGALRAIEVLNVDQ